MAPFFMISGFSRLVFSGLVFSGTADAGQEFKHFAAQCFTLLG